MIIIQEIDIFLNNIILEYISEYYADIGLYKSAKIGSKYLAIIFIKKGACELNWGIATATKYKHIDLIKLLINKGANNFDWAMCEAAFYGHKDLVDFFIDKGSINFLRSCEYARLGHHHELAEYIGQIMKEN